MKYLCIGDLHIKADNTAQINRLEAQIISLLNSELAREKLVIVILGDVLHHHERLHTLALNRALQFITNMSARAHVYVLVGNHDYIQNDQFLSENHWMNSLKTRQFVTIVDKFTWDVDGNCAFLPYVPPGRFLEALETDNNWANAALIFAHQEFRGAQMRGHQSTIGDDWCADRPTVISGHIHSRQFLNSGVLYVGSPVPENVHSGDFSLTLADSEQSRAPKKWRQFHLVFPRARSITVKLEDISPEWMESIKEQTYRVIIQGATLEEFKVFQKSRAYAQLLKQGNKITFRPVARAPADLSANGARAPHVSFESLLFKNVLLKQDSWLYGAALRVMGAPDVCEEDLLIVPLLSAPRS